MIDLPYMAAFVLYMLGALFILIVFLPEDTRQSHKLLALALVWPIYTMYLIAHEFFTSPDD